MKILFLDADGVLNRGSWYDEETGHCSILRELVWILNRVVNETKCHIVLSSAWRDQIYNGTYNLAGFGAMLRTHGLVPHCGATSLVVGVTEQDGEMLRFMVGERGNQCRNWLNAHPDVTVYAAVDDIEQGFAAAGIPAVITDPALGLTEANADALIAILNAND